MRTDQSFSRTTVIALVVIVAHSLVGCLGDQAAGGSESGTTVINNPTPGQPVSPLTPPERTICDPFNTHSPSARDRGVVANLVWLSDEHTPRGGQTAPHHVSEYFELGNIVESTLYFDRIFTPTRAFDLGFFTQEGEQVLNQHNEPLYEYFALNMEGQLQLGPDEPEGDYQIAVLADDGAVLKVSDGAGGWTTIVDNDGEHSTRMGCPSDVLHMTRNTKLPFQLQYFQGPRFHISLAVMWRLVPSGADTDIPVVEAECGLSGNSRYWDSTVVPSQTKQPFYELLARNWKVLENENYYFPEQASNPCVPTEETLAISNFQITGVTRTSMTLNWTTNVASDSKVEYRNVVTGAVLQTLEDSTLVTNHTLTVTGLSPNTLYAFKGLSVTTGGQNAVSDERALRTQR